MKDDYMRAQMACSPRVTEKAKTQKSMVEAESDLEDKIRLLIGLHVLPFDL